MPRNWFAVLDGAHFDDLPVTLAERRMLAHPLYLEAGGASGVKAGPHLLELAGPQEVTALLDLIIGKPAATFWSWPNGLHTLRRHLRSLNLVEIPNERRAYPDNSAYETVLFRHWDPAVLAVTLPVLTPEQLCRFRGSAYTVIFDPANSGDVAALHQPARLLPVQRGWLRFDGEQVAAITNRRMGASQDRIAKYLREATPEQTSGLSDDQLRAAIANSDREARAFGLKAERDIGRWTYLQLMLGGNLLSDPHALATILDQSSSLPASERMSLYFNLAARAC
jgi:hypothetical protein